MQPSKEYLESIAKRLEAMNPGLTPERVKEMKRPQDTSGLMGDIGSAALNFLKNKKDQNIDSDPLFPDRNTY
jgi:hypothetical protein